LFRSCRSRWNNVGFGETDFLFHISFHFRVNIAIVLQELASILAPLSDALGFEAEPGT